MFVPDVDGRFDSGHVESPTDTQTEDEQQLTAITSVSVRAQMFPVYYWLISSSKISSDLLSSAASIQERLVPRAAKHLPQGANLAGSHSKDDSTILGRRSRNAKENQPPVVGSEEAGGEDTNVDSGESEDDTVKNNSKKRKVTRGDQLKDRLRVRLTEGAYAFFRARIATQNGFPDSDLKSEFAREAFADSYDDLERRGINLEGTSPCASLDEADLVRHLPHCLLQLTTSFTSVDRGPCCANPRRHQENCTGPLEAPFQVSGMRAQGRRQNRFQPKAI